MSGTIEAARLAASEAPIPVEVVDSETIGMAMGFAVVAAAESRRRCAERATAVLEAVRGRGSAPSGVLFYVDTLEHLRRGGRIGAASALLGSALAIKPILAVRGGRIMPVEKVRTSSRAVARIEAMVARVRHQGRHAGRHRRAPPRRRGARRADRGRPAPQPPARRRPRCIVVELGAVVGAHVGPGTVAIAVSPRPGEPLPEPAEAPAP